MEEAIQSGDQKQFGEALHTWQDSFRHGGYGGNYIWFTDYFFGHGIATGLSWIGLMYNPDSPLLSGPFFNNDKMMMSTCLESAIKFNKQNPGSKIEINMKKFDKWMNKPNEDAWYYKTLSNYLKNESLNMRRPLFVNSGRLMPKAYDPITGEEFYGY